MAHPSKKHQNKQSLLEDEEIPVKQFLFKTTLLKFLSFGRRCNGNANNSFPDATCDLTKLTKNGPKGLWFGIPMTEVFKSGYELLKNVLDENTSYDFSKEELSSLTTLTTFFREKDIHEKSILKALEKINDTSEKSTKESILTTALAEHLFGRLSPGQECLVDSRMKSKDITLKENSNEKCMCGCGEAISFGATGIGHEEVWHGFADIVIKSSNKRPESAVNVCLELNVDDGPPPAKIMKISDETDEEGENDESIAEAKLSSDMERVQNRTAAQTVVFSLAYRAENPCSTTFIPNILMCSSKFYLVMFEPVNDVLVWSTEFPIFSHSDKRLQGVSIIALWMVLHYKLFCNSAVDIFEDMSEIKAGFRNQIDDDHWAIYNNQMKMGISSFSTAPSLDLANSLNDVDYDLPKLKVNNPLS